VDTEPVVLELAGHPFEVTNPNKVFFTQRGDTKLDLVNFYRQVEGPIMAAMGGRPVLLQRFPNGASGKSFFQKRVPEKRPDWLPRPRSPRPTAPSRRPWSSRTSPT